MVDDIDVIIIKELIKNSRVSARELSQKLNICQSTLYYRIKNLEDKGIIRKYTIDVDWRKLGFLTTAFILVKYDPNKAISQEDLAKKLLKFEEVEEVYIITGEYDILIKVRFRNTQELSNFVLDKLRTLEGVATSQTLLVLKEIW